MGKTSRKLNIVVFDYLKDWPEIEVLHEQGHNITIIQDVNVVDDPLNPGTLTQGRLVYEAKILLDADVVLGPNCWLMDRDHKKYLNICLKAARLKKYGSSKKSKKVGDENEEDDLDDLCP